MQSKKEIDQENLASSPVIYIDDSDDFECNSIPKKTKKSRNRKIKLNIDNNMETLVVTHKVNIKKHKTRFPEVKKQKLECIINETNVCNTKEKKKKKKRSKKSIEDRIVPLCLRECYQNRSELKRKSARKESVEDLSASCDDLSLISISSLERHSDISYEDVSSESFFDFDDDNEIDKLIKRTKDRDRRLSRLSDQEPSKDTTRTTYTAENDSDAETWCLLERVELSSIHSTTTLILEPEIYSPTRPTASPEPNNNSTNLNNMLIESSHLTNKMEVIEKPGEIKTQKIFVRSPHSINSFDRDRKPTTAHHQDSAANTLYEEKVFSHSYNIKNEPYSPSETPLPLWCHPSSYSPMVQ